jgi:hypothetical protein
MNPGAIPGGWQECAGRYKYKFNCFSKSLVVMRPFLISMVRSRKSMRVERGENSHSREDKELNLSLNEVQSESGVRAEELWMFHIPKPSSMKRT